jgi:hypothetical protein
MDPLLLRNQMRGDVNKYYPFMEKQGELEHIDPLKELDNSLMPF